MNIELLIFYIILISYYYANPACTPTWVLSIQISPFSHQSSCYISFAYLSLIDYLFSHILKDSDSCFLRLKMGSYLANKCRLKITIKRNDNRIIKLGFLSLCASTTVNIPPEFICSEANLSTWGLDGKFGSYRQSETPCPI